MPQVCIYDLFNVPSQKRGITTKIIVTIRPAKSEFKENFGRWQNRRIFN